jgi:hypothetical protein
MRALLERLTKSGGAVTVVTTTPAAGAQKFNGWAVNGAGVPHVTSGGAAVPATREMYQGIAFTPAGAMYMTDTAPAANATQHQGFSIRLDGALHVNSGSVPATNTSIANAAVASGRLHESGL